MFDSPFSVNSEERTILNPPKVVFCSGTDVMSRLSIEQVTARLRPRKILFVDPRPPR